jgi:hypothetical protein
MLAGDISAPGGSLSLLSVRLLLKARRGAGGRVTAGRGPDGLMPRPGHPGQGSPGRIHIVAIRQPAGF